MTALFLSNLLPPVIFGHHFVKSTIKISLDSITSKILLLQDNVFWLLCMQIKYIHQISYECPILNFIIMNEYKMMVNIQ